MARSRRNARRTKGARGAPARRPLTSFTAPEHDPLSDSRLRPLVERYGTLVGARVEEVGPQVLELHLPASEQNFFGGGPHLLVAFSVPALERTPEAEMAVVGSPFVDQLLEAIRAHGARIELGLVPSSRAGESPPLGVAVRDGASGTPKVKRARRAVGRMLARVIIRAGAAVEEHLLESRFLDFVSGEPLPQDVATRCAAIEQGMLVPDAAPPAPNVKRAAARDWAELLDLMVGDLEAKLAPRLDTLRSEASRTLAAELERIDSYYHRMLEDVSARGPAAMDDDAFASASRAIEAEHARRRVEEERRHRVRTIVHPLQLVEMAVLVETARWTLTDSHGDRATLDAVRYVVREANSDWRVSCPTCRRVPPELVVRGDGRVACSVCAGRAAEE